MNKLKLDPNDVVFSTHWFKIRTKCYQNATEPFYVLDASDAVSIIALTKEQQVILVQQYRPAIDSESLELPGGHMKDKETPEEAARRELLEETGYRADTIKLLGVLFPNTTRLGYKLWCYFAPDTVKMQEPQSDEISKLVFCNPPDLAQFIKNGTMKNALDVAAVYLSKQSEII